MKLVDVLTLSTNLCRSMVYSLTWYFISMQHAHCWAYNQVIYESNTPKAYQPQRVLVVIQPKPLFVPWLHWPSCTSLHFATCMDGWLANNERQDSLHQWFCNIKRLATKIPTHIYCSQFTITQIILFARPGTRSPGRRMWFQLYTL